MADPFTWKLEDVVNFLCSSSIEVTEDAGALTSKLREGRLNGRRLLTFGILLSDRQLQEHLGLTEAWQQLELAEAIVDLRRQSAAFQEWEARRNGAPTPKFKSETSPASVLPGPSANSAKTETSEPRSHIVGKSGTGPGDPLVANVEPNHLQDEVVAAASAQSAQDGRDTGKRPHNTSETIPADATAEGNDVRPAKRPRRAVLVHISSETGTVPQPSFNTEEDHFSVETQAQANVVNWKLLESAGPNAYLGEGALRPDDIRSTTMTLSSRIIDKPDGSFAVTIPNRLPPGQRLVVYRTTKRLFVENHYFSSLIAAGHKPPPREGSISLEDLPSDYDEETKREFAAERQELGQERSRQLTKEEITTTMKESINKTIEDWHEIKRPKYERRAFKLWTTASRQRSRQVRIEEAKQTLAHLEARLMKMQRDIAEMPWKNRQDVVRQCLSFEITIEDQCYQNWLVSLLSSRSPPARPEQLPRPRRAPRLREDLSEGDEVLMSTDDDNDFVIDDTEEASAQLQQDVQSAAARRQREPSVMDLTITPQEPKLIDLTGSPAGDRQEDMASVNGRREMPERGSQNLITSELVRNAKENEPKKFGKMHGKIGILLSLLWKLDHATRVQVFAKANETNTDSIWNDTVEIYLARLGDLPSSEDPEAHRGHLQPETLQVAFEMCRLFLMYWRNHHYPDSKLLPAIKRRLSDARKESGTKNHFKAFLRIIQQAAPHFLNESIVYRREALLQDSDDEFADDPPDEATPSRRRRGAAVEVMQDKNAVDLREREARRNADLQAARERFWKKMAASDTVPADRTQHIINEGKRDHQGLIYINEEIGKRIKQHQIDGVRFLWNQIVQDADERQGCLLAHTMGLGKTMQVITFLVALHEATDSDDPTVREQVPHDLRQNPTLVLCPAGLVDNWMEELKSWAPLDTLNPLRKIASDITPEERLFSLEQWADTGGVLVIGYEMLKQLFDMDDRTAELLMRTPTTVVADEAHRLKNSSSKLHNVCSRFETKARIALTGSPLANNVEEYYHMINWVAPNFLGPPQEFKDIYSKDIEAGLYHDSVRIQKRQAIKMLQVLKETVAPKVHRATITALKDDLPNKHEFVISVAPTHFQKSLYNACVQVIRNNASDLRQSQIFAVLGILSLVCNHPKCLQVRVKDVKEREKDGAGVFSSALIATVLTMTRGMDIDDPSLSSKMTLLTKILDQARASGDKVLIFTTSIPTLQYLQHVLVQQKRKVAVLDGSTSINKRQNNVKGFNEGQKEVYVISTKAGGVGLNIQGANRVVLFDFKWNPMDEQQAIGRAYRIGQKKTVFVYRFVLAGTFEEDLHNKAVFKTQLASRVVDKKNPISWSKRGGQLIHDVNKTPKADLTPFLGKDEVLDCVIKDYNDIVRSIMSTDAFEEEDHTAALTADELKETDQLVHMNRLRTTDPAAYQRAMERQRAAAYSSVGLPNGQTNIPVPTQVVFRSQATPNPLPEPATRPVDTTISTIAQSMDGASDFPFVRSKTTGGVFGLSSTRGPPKLRYHAGPEVDMNLPIPPPIAGANTYFGQHPQSAPPEPPTAARGPGQTPFQTNRSMAKSDFEQSFAEHVLRLGANWPRPQSYNQATITAIVNEVDQLRKNKGLGFLPDDLQWKSLKDQLKHPRFTAAAAFRRLTPQWLAFANRHDMKTRLDILDEMSEAEFARFLEGTGNSTDPMNLDNIRRPNFSAPGTPRSAHAHEDMKAMRAAADRRRTRNSSLPSWALSALPTANQ